MSSSSQPAAGGVLAPGSRVMGLKFMQRRQAKVSGASPVPTVSPAGAPSAGTSAVASVEAAELAKATMWTMPSHADAAEASAGAGAPVESAACDGDGEVQALLQFRSGRRSFGGANPRLEKRLHEIGENQRAAAEDIKAAAAREAERRRRAEEHAALQARADAEEEAERLNGVSESEMAASLGRYVPQQSRPPARIGGGARAGAADDGTGAGPPIVSNPVRVREAPAGAGGARGGGSGGKPGSKGGGKQPRGGEERSPKKGKGGFKRPRVG